MSCIQAAMGFPVSYAVILLAMVKEDGGDIVQLMRNTDIRPERLVEMDARLSAKQLWSLIDNAIELTENPALGLYFGKKLTLTTHGLLGYALMHSRNLRQAMELLTRYYRLLFDEAKLTITIRADRLYLSYEVDSSLKHRERLSSEIFFSSVWVSLKQLLHREDIQAALQFSYVQPDYTDDYIQLFGDDIHFSAKANRINFPLGLLEEPLAFANHSMLLMYQKQCEQLLAKFDGQDAGRLGVQIREYLLESGPPYPSLEQTASHFNLSGRTLRRRLQKEGYSYQDVMDNFRRNLAETYLRNHAFSIEHIADLLGFSDTSNFRRAFIRWTGISPSCYKKQWFK